MTTARDLGRVLWTIQAAAVGNRRALERLGLDQERARLALGHLLDSQARGENNGLIRPFFPPSLPLARKEGWISEARLSPAIVYDGKAPHIVVCLAYAPTLSLEDARRFSHQAVKATGITS